MTTLLARTIAHLTELVRDDTQNPPRAITHENKLFSYSRDVLARAGFAVRVLDHGAGAVTLFAVRGEPRILFNVHLDTVPAAGWTSNPHVLRVENGKAIGLGAADTKGAAACLLALAEVTKDDAAFLFTSDEEAGDPRCIRAFLETKPDFDLVIVAEPTECRATLAHRGMASAMGTFSGTGGHGSAPRAMVDSAVHESVRWAARALDFAAAEESRELGGLSGIRLNIGVLEGGTKANMIADTTRVRFAVRSRPSEDPRGLVSALGALASDPARFAFETTFVGPPLPGPGRTIDAALAHAKRLGLTVGPPVDFWSEASLFSAAGSPALVFGPGRILEAHTKDEWVAESQLEEALATYQRILSCTTLVGHSHANDSRNHHSSAPKPRQSQRGRAVSQALRQPRLAAFRRDSGEWKRRRR